MPNRPIRVLIVDDHRIIREGLRVLLRSDPGVEVVGEAADGRAAVTMAAELSPDVVVMDITMPDLNGIDATRRIRSSNGHSPKVIALSAHADRRYATEMLSAGAAGFVIKEAAYEELSLALKTVMTNKLYLSPAVSEVIVEGMRSGGAPAGPTVFSELTPREREVLQLMAEGKATKQVAMHLHVSVKTAESHRRNLMEKLKLHSLAELTKYAIREGLTSA